MGSIQFIDIKCYKMPYNIIILYILLGLAVAGWLSLASSDINTHFVMSDRKREGGERELLRLLGHALLRQCRFSPNLSGVMRVTFVGGVDGSVHCAVVSASDIILLHFNIIVFVLLFLPFALSFTVLFGRCLYRFHSDLSHSIPIH